MIKTNLYNESESKRIVASKGAFSVLEYVKDMSNDFGTAFMAYYASEMNVRKRQAMVRLNNSGVILQAGAMQMILGDVNVATNVKGVGDLAKKFIGSKVTGETTIKPKYEGTGTVVLEPTYKHILLEDLGDWSTGMVIEDGLFLACDSTIELKVVARSTFSSAILGNEGLFNSCLYGQGIAVLESPVPAEELIVLDLENDTVKIDGSMAIAWSSSLKFTVERTTATLVGSAASGEGLVNVYRGTGRILVAPVRTNWGIVSAEGGNTGSFGTNLSR